jgi:type II secretory pathway predicted ATPase ExeA
MHIPSRHPSSRPFMAAPRTQFYHPAQQIDAALKSVERCIRRGEGMALVVGAPGTGKSLLLSMVAEHVRDDFDVALLSGASICTRRALWQSILAAIGERFRGIDEGELRMAIVERIRGLAATGSGLVILVDEAATLPTRLIEELRLLTNVPTPLPAVHIVLGGGLRLEELLAAPRMESLAQRIAVRGYLEPLDHAETVAYLRTQTKAAGLEWDKLFAADSDDAVFKATDGVPRLINQVCDQALVLVAECNRRVTPADIASAWREIQRLPPPSGLEPRGAPPQASGSAAGQPAASPFECGDDGLEMIEFGAGDEGVATLDVGQGDSTWPARDVAADPPAAHDPWSGPDVELVAGHGDDPFAALFQEDTAGGAAWCGEGPDDFRTRPHVTSRDGQAISRLLASLPGPADPSGPAAAAPAPAPSGPAAPDDDADMVLIVDDPGDPEPVAGRVAAVRPDDYRSLFTRLRRGDRR